MIITLVRHMETEMNQKKLLQGMIDAKLNRQGIKQSHDFAEKVDLTDVDAIYSSNLQRARYLGKLLADRIDKGVIIDERLNEICLGDWEGYSVEQIKTEFKDVYDEWDKDSTNNPTPNGESYKEVENRAIDFLEDLTKRNYKKAFVVTHSAVIKVILCSIHGESLEEKAKYKIYNGTMAVIETTDNGFILKEIKEFDL